MSSSYIAYVDESGDEGFQFTKGSSKWFVVSAVLVARDRELTEVKLVDDVRDQINSVRLPQHRIPDKKPLHFRDLKHEARKYYSTKVGAAQLNLVSVCIYKPDLTSPEVFQKEFRLYFYATRLLVERISWCCRDHTRKNLPGDGSVEIIFSNRGYMDYRAMCEYLARIIHGTFEYRRCLAVNGVSGSVGTRWTAFGSSFGLGSAVMNRSLLESVLFEPRRRSVRAAHRAEAV